ncbi:MAG: Lrp/AsnC family transcriptional regulator [Anaerostipes sp.]|uniref:Lrp/AsnC family transcriptional regulator n=1 Tax=Anaerostipes sp. 992a TaxID=1261637 RepID=UPI000952253D|nr:Lrp/AsnC family transcriptional regulator [Anaerostipes sp. 992a]MCI5951805.1 Lrp/AsnC family transcriptional regulator [Anaerostipes sp.]MDD5968691.1 Lrp/AsnC family transcriptional regulator [Anaerostipes sp.]OLR60948.1 AsnC family transcriptional regulator [Anaerostipes sp. 992a]
MRTAILKLMEKNSRIDFQDVADMLDTDLETVKKTVKEMEDEHIICGYHTLINWDKEEEERVTAMIEVRITPQRGRGFDKIAERIYNYPEVKTVYLMSGTYDLMVILEEKTLKEISHFTSNRLAVIDSVIGTTTHFVLKKYKDHGTILAEPVDERMAVTP